MVDMYRGTLAGLCRLSVEDVLEDREEVDPLEQIRPCIENEVAFYSNFSGAHQHQVVMKDPTALHFFVHRGKFTVGSGAAYWQDGVLEFPAHGTGTA